MEFIASSTQAEATEDYFTARIVGLMRSRHLTFVQAARDVARRDLTGHGERAVRSADLRPGDSLADAPVRQAVAFSIAHYHGLHHADNLPLVAQHLGSHGPARRALRADYGAGNIAVMSDPTGMQIRQAIQLAIDNVASLANARRVAGELTLFFDGHGDETGMQGSDGDWFRIGELLAFDAQARRTNVHLIVVSNECFQGGGAIITEAAGGRALLTELGSRHLSPEQHTRLRTLLAHAQELIQFGHALSPVLDRLAQVADNEPHHAAAPAVIEELRSALARQNTPPERPVENGFVAATPGLNHHISRVWDMLQGSHSADRAFASSLRRDLDWISDHMIEEVAELEEWVRTYLDLSLAGL